MSITLEFKDVAVGRPAPADPNVPVLVHINSVFCLGPIKSFARSAPGGEQMPLSVESQNRRRCEAAQRTRRFRGSAQFANRVRAGSLQNPDVVLPIYS